MLYLHLSSLKRVLEEASTRLREVTRDSAHYQQMLRDLVAQVTTTLSFSFSLNFLTDLKETVFFSYVRVCFNCWKGK